RPHEERDRGGVAHDDGRRPDPLEEPRQPRAGDPPDVRVPLRDRLGGGARPRPRRDAPRPQPVQQLPDALAHRGPGRHPEGGARAITIAGTTAYISCDAGLVLVSIDDPLKPKLLKTIGRPWLTKPRAVEVQFRYAFVIDEKGLKVIDVGVPAEAQPVPGAVVP